MILKGSQRGGVTNLAQHLLKPENDHVHVAELRDLVSDDLTGALREIEATAKGTRCKQPLFSVSLNPPQTENVPTEAFFKAIDQMEERLGLTGQPRAVVFHEKEGRRHAHVVWSRIGATENGLKAVPMPFYKNRLKELSRDLYLEHGWQMPKGLMSSAERSAGNFELADWQKAKRLGIDARDVKESILDAWAVSTDRQTFAEVLETRGFKLAKGDRRDFVAVGMDGDVWSVPRVVGQKTKEVRAKLGEAINLPTVEQRKAEFAAQISDRLKALREQNRLRYAEKREQISRVRAGLVARQTVDREALSAFHQARDQQERTSRQARFNKGLRGVIDRVSGHHSRIKVQNEMDAYQALRRDQQERDALVFRQLEERRALQQHILAVRTEHKARVRDITFQIALPNISAENREIEQKRYRVRQRQSASPQRQQLLEIGR